MNESRITKTEDKTNDKRPFRARQINIYVDESVALNVVLAVAVRRTLNVASVKSR